MNNTTMRMVMLTVPLILQALASDTVDNRPCSKSCGEHVLHHNPFDYTSLTNSRSESLSQHKNNIYSVEPFTLNGNKSWRREKRSSKMETLLKVLAINQSKSLYNDKKHADNVTDSPITTSTTESSKISENLHSSTWTTVEAETSTQDIELATDSVLKIKKFNFSPNNNMADDRNDSSVSKSSASLLNTLLEKDGITGLRELLSRRFRIKTPVDVVATTLDGEIIEDAGTLRQNNASIQNTTISVVEIKNVSKNEFTDDTKMIVHLLNDIKYILKEVNAREYELWIENMELQYDNLKELTISKMDVLNNNFQESIDNTDEKVKLVLDMFSMIKILVLEHEKKIKNNENAISELNEHLKEFTEEVNQTSITNTLQTNTESSLSEIYTTELSLDSEKVEDDYAEVVRNLSNTVKVNQEEINNELSDLHKQIKRLETSAASYEGKLDRYVMRNNQKNNQNLPFSEDATTETKSKCDIGIEALQNEIRSLKETVASQSMLIDVLQSSAASIQQNIDDINNHIESSTDEQTTRSITYPTDSPNIRSTDNMIAVPSEDAVFSDAAIVKFVNVEDRLKNFEEELQAVRDLRDEVAFLRRIMERSGPEINATNEVLCVWPYSLTGTGCLHVSTEERLSWSSARDRCRQLQGDLATPRDLHVFRKFMTSQKLSRTYGFWLGATDVDGKGRWAWLDGRAVPPGAWATGQPNEPRTNACMEVRHHQRLLGADEPCSQQKFFVCQQRGS